MELSAGTRLGPYEIVRTIGAGGMGVVYRANDTRLDRSVALKVLPAELRSDADRMRRFEQEARTIGGLNHPNLVTLHDVGRHDDVPYLVTELLDGQSLRQKLTDAPLSLREAVEIACEIARGLAAAHGAGIVHRDIKPDNVFVTKDGRVKILDFGIAKLQRGTPEDLASAATLAGSGTAATGTGVVIGTPGYMAPEQLAGGDVDARTDVFAFGVVLYEMLARKRPFAADTSVEESYAIVKTPPPPLPDSVPPALARIAMRCLEKRRELRFQSAADLAFALDAFEMAPSGVTAKRSPGPEISETTEPVRKVSARRIPIVPLVVILAAALVAIVWVKRDRHPSAGETGTWPSLVEGGPVWQRVTYANQQKWFARFAPDGKSVLYSLRIGDDYHVVRTDVAHPTVVPVGNVEGRLLDISPSGVLALRQRRPDQHGGLLVTFVEGAGAPRERAENVHDATFVGEDLAIVHDYGTGMSLELPIGKELLRRDGVLLEFLRASPDASLIAFAEHPIVDDSRGVVRVLDRSGHEVTHSPKHASIDGLAWSPSGGEVWLSTEAGLQALDLHGKERVLLRSAHDMFLRDVRRDDGWMLVAPQDLAVHTYMHHAGGANDDQIGWRSTTVNAISRDGSTIALIEGTGFDETADGYQLYIRKGTDTPVPIEHGFDVALSPDGSRAILLAGAGDPLRIVPTDARGGTAHAIALGPVERFDFSARLEVSADGKRVYAIAAAKDQPMRIWSFDLEGTTPPTPFGPDHIDRAEDELHPRFRFAVSPDGSWIAVPGAKGVRLLSTTGADELTLPGDHAESPLAFTDDGALLVWRSHGYPRPISRVELAAPYQRTQVMSFDPLERPEHVDAAVAGDGTTIAYDWLSLSSDLYVLEKPNP